MPLPVVHLLWGYVVSRRLTGDPRLVMAGTAMALLPDADVLIPGVTHHGFLHTPLFAFVVVASVYGAAEDKLVPLVLGCGLLSHLVLDSIASTGGLMWLFPSEVLLPYGLFVSLPALVSLKVFLFVIPLQVVLHQSRERGEGPHEVFDYLRERMGVMMATAAVGCFLVLIVSVSAYTFLAGIG